MKPQGQTDNLSHGLTRRFRPKDEAARAAMACVAGVVGWPERCTFNNLAYLFDDWDFLNRQ
ncbi:MAG: hypothetical protein ACI8R4_001714, partial [Paracoccaceae bacterium]